MQVTVGSKYQIVIPKEVRAKIKGLRPGTKVNISLNDEDIIIKNINKNWLKRTKGTLKEAWKGVDTSKYLDELRNEWDQKS